MSRISRSRASLMFGGASAALAAMLLASPASAQSSTDQITGARVVASHQRSDHAQAVADTSGLNIMVAAPPVETSDLALRGNAVSAEVRANRSDSVLTTEPLDVAEYGWPTLLTTGNGGVAADGTALIVTTQRSVASPVTARGIDNVVAISTDTTRDSHVAVSDNTLETLALGNDASAALSLTDVPEPLAGGILGYQSNDRRSSVTSTNTAAVRVGTGASTGSDITMSGNLVRALGYGNAFSSDFTATGAAALGDRDGRPASQVASSADGDATVSATFATLSHQEQGGTVSVHAGDALGSDPFHLVVFGGLAGSAALHDGDALVAGGYGNQSRNAMDLQVGMVSGSGPVANITNLQRAADSSISAETLGGIRTNVLGEVDGSRLSLSRNAVRTVAVANLAEGNQLNVEANGIDTMGGLETGPVGTASVGNDNSISTTAAFSVQNVQDIGEAKVGAASTSALKLGVLGPVEQSSLSADGNNVSVAATGNAATNGLSLKAPMLRTSADLNNVQAANGTVRVQAGDAVTPLGVVLALSGTVRGSDLSVRDNDLAGTATANSASNAMTIEGATLANGSGHGEAISGPLADGYGAAADFALANSQKLGLSGSPEDAVAVSSTVIGRFGMLGDSRTYASSYDVSGNAVGSTVLGNTAANRLSVTAATLGDLGSPAPGTALSSAQYAQVIGQAYSSSTLVAPGSLSGSAVSLDGNINQAIAAINQADNGLSAHSVTAGLLSGRDAHVASGTTTAVSGDDVLGNLQFAGGRISAIASTSVEHGDAGDGLISSRFGITGNVTSAEASANRAINTVDMGTLVGSGVSAGLGSMQMSTADISASATIDMGYRASAAAMPLIDASSVTIADNVASALSRGNAADNQLTVSGSASFDPQASSQSSRYAIWAEAGAPLLNAQTNYGAVSASASSLIGSAFNGPLAGMTGASMEVRGNTVAAAAYGNTAANTVSGSSLGRAPTAAIVSSQTNYGPVTAFATGNQFTVPLTTMSGSSLALTGNQVSAVAVGNQATNIVTSLR
ncbi:hypothetical protein HZY97_09765 [Sphingomonas sp. R-74633]|uniref:beta strand repeat-containing protein n=1 Tax=Sphingomonas sp. R-74633 TaxID=2751188 RepID=UPI0015D37AE6|nr:hypothetical protein [Sphingomonas sp. R-74633]NYT41042.1 hypothetical protein [Sphingomonas sp. R-74633]